MQIVAQVVDAVARQGALEAALSAVQPELAAGLLQHCRCQLGRPRLAAAAVVLAEHLIVCCPAALGTRGTAPDALERLQGAVTEELRTQERLMALRGMVAAFCG